METPENKKSPALPYEFDIKQGYWKGCLLPTVTIVIGVSLCAIALRYFFVQDSYFDESKKATDRHVYYNAQECYSNGDLDDAEKLVQQILKLQPRHAQANQLMAKIELARGDKNKALEYLRRSLDASLNREEVAKWIAGLETAAPAPSGAAQK